MGRPPWNRLPREVWHAICLGYLGGDLCPLVAPSPVCRRHLRIPVGRLTRPDHRLVVALHSWSRVARPACRKRIRSLATCRARGRCAGCGRPPLSRAYYRETIARYRTIYRPSSPLFACPSCRLPGSRRPHLELLTPRQARRRFGLSRAGLAAVRALVPEVPCDEMGTVLLRAAAVAAALGPLAGAAAGGSDIILEDLREEACVDEFRPVAAPGAGDAESRGKGNGVAVGVGCGGPDDGGRRPEAGPGEAQGRVHGSAGGADEGDDDHALSQKPPSVHRHRWSTPSALDCCPG